jgi:hypothetical protein
LIATPIFIESRFDSCAYARLKIVLEEPENSTLSRTMRNIVFSKAFRPAMLLAACVVGCTLLVAYTNDYFEREPVKIRLRHYFIIKPGEELTKTSIRKAVLAQLPIGSTSNSIEAYFAKTGLNKDKQISISGTVDDPEIICKFDYDPDFTYEVRHSYDIILHMDKNKQMNGVSVETSQDIYSIIGL